MFIEILSLDPDIYQGVMTPDPDIYQGVMTPDPDIYKGVMTPDLDPNHCLPLSCIFKVKMYSSFFVLSFLS